MQSSEFTAEKDHIKSYPAIDRALQVLRSRLNISLPRSQNSKLSHELKSSSEQMEGCHPLANYESIDPIKVDSADVYCARNLHSLHDAPVRANSVISLVCESLQHKNPSSTTKTTTIAVAENRGLDRSVRDICDGKGDCVPPAAYVLSPSARRMVLLVDAVDSHSFQSLASKRMDSLMTAVALLRDILFHPSMVKRFHFNRWVCFVLRRGAMKAKLKSSIRRHSFAEYLRIHDKYRPRGPSRGRGIWRVEDVIHDIRRSRGHEGLVELFIGYRRRKMLMEVFIRNYVAQGCS